MMVSRIANRKETQIADCQMRHEKHADESPLPIAMGRGRGRGLIAVSVIINLYLIFIYRKREW